jgi:hypothetical protein
LFQAASLRVESLEARSLLTAPGLNGLGPVQFESEPNDTVDQAQLLGDLSTQRRAGVIGTIGNSPAHAADVDWYSFTLDGPAQVSLDLTGRGAGRPFNGVLSLYNNDRFDLEDLLDPSGYRLLAQSVSGGDGAAQIERDLSPGTYEVAISGAGNVYFNPLLAGSGFAGSIGDYRLRVDSTPVNFGPGSGPAVLTSDPAPGAVLAASPFVIRLDLSEAIDPSTLLADQTARLTYNPAGTFGDGNDQDVSLAWTNAGVGGTELQLAPAAPLAPGYYQVFVAGNSSTGAPVVADSSGNPLGATAANPQGQDYIETFQIDGIKGRTGAGATSDDTPATAQNLGDITTQGLVQVAGAIGSDPYYNTADAAHNPANDVDLYHFQISGPGRFAFAAEVFAGRIGSPLDPGVSLYQLDPTDDSLEFLAGNNNTSNVTPASDGSTPLAFDSMLSQGLTAGDYYIAVAGGFNVPSPTELQPVGSPGLLDPTISHSAQNGATVGPYVLNLLVQPVPLPPQVLASSVAAGAVLTQPPTRIVVQFDQPVNLLQQAYGNYLQTNLATAPSVFIQGADGTVYNPLVDSYDRGTNSATLLMADRLPAGSYALHLSGPLGLTDLAGNPLVGNDPSGDFVIQFRVTAVDPVQSTGSGSSGQIVAHLGRNGFQSFSSSQFRRPSWRLM